MTTETKTQITIAHSLEDTMDKAKAKIIYKNGALTPNGREKIMQLRRGAKGTGELIHSVRYWPWSEKSVEAADHSIFEAARNAQVEIEDEDATD